MPTEESKVDNFFFNAFSIETNGSMVKKRKKKRFFCLNYGYAANHNSVVNKLDT